jgi:hypothetical protein
MYGFNVNIQIGDFILTQTGTYQEQSLRPFTTTVTTDSLNALDESTRGGRNLGVTAVESVAGSVVRPSATPEAGVNIAQGWASRRFRFLMRVVEEHPLKAGRQVQRILFGYTDHSDASVNHLDPEMRIYFNSETVIADQIRNTPNGPVSEPVVMSANQIISPLDMFGPQANFSAYYQSPSSYLIRPEDVFGMGQTRSVTDKLMASGQFEGGLDLVMDSRNTVGQGGAYKYSRRRDTSPSRYLSDTLNAYHHAMKESQMSDDESVAFDQEVLYGEAQSHASNHDIHKNMFFARLKDEAGFMERGYVTYRELQQMFPEVQHTTKYSLDDGRSIRQVNQAQDSERWMGSDNMTIAASTLAQVVPSIMMDNYIRTVSFAVTNGHGYGEYLIEFHEQGTTGVVKGLNMINSIQEFHRRLITDVLNTVTLNNQLGFQISMSSDLAGDSVIDIAIDGEPVRRYVAPTFSDSLFTPMITHDRERPQTISKDLLYLVEQTIPNDRGTSNLINAHGQPFGHEMGQAGHPAGNPFNSSNMGYSNGNDTGLL